MLPFELTKDTPYLALSGELWSVFYEYFNRNWPCYKGFLLYYMCITGLCYNSTHLHLVLSQYRLIVTSDNTDGFSFSGLLNDNFSWGFLHVSGLM